MMDINQPVYETLESHNAYVDDRSSPVLTISDSAYIMQQMMATINLNDLLAIYAKLLCNYLPSTALKLSFADQVIQTGQLKATDRSLKISIDYAQNFGAPQHAQLAYRFLKVLNANERKMLSEMHAIFSMPLKNALEFYRISLLATKDMLTGLGNRAHFDDSANKIISISKRNLESFGLLVIDLDNFKQVNDLHGHQEGDNVLTQFSHILSRCLRDSDHAFRFGGDEFCCLLLDSDASANEMVAQRINKAVRTDTLMASHGVSCSVGATSFQVDDDQKKMFARADKALYLAKQAGKNLYMAA